MGFIRLLLLLLEFPPKSSLMTTFPFLLIPTDPSSAKQLEDKYGLFFWKKLGLNSKDHMELSALAAHMKFFKLSQ